MTARRPYGPGPGAYMLPTTVGYDKHDLRKNRLPQYSIGSRFCYRGGRDCGPGPGAYKVDRLTRYGYGIGPAFTIAPRIKISSRDCGPGPGAHDIRKGTSGPAFTIAGRQQIRSKDCNPGPNNYSVDVRPIKPGIPAFSIGARMCLSKKDGSPGPAAYGPGNICSKLPCSPAFSMGHRYTFSSKDCGPGPNYYNLMYYRPGKNHCGYSFGVKHHEYSPPMIVCCDNL